MTDMPAPRLGAEQLIGSTFSFQHRPLAEALAFLAREGMTEVELWGVAPHLDLFDTDASRLAEVGRQLRDNGLRLHCYTPEQVLYPVNISAGDARYREASVNRFLRAVDICAELGGRYLLVTAGRGFETEPPERAWDHAAESLSRIAAHAGQSGVRCLLEPLQRSESNILHSAQDVRRMLDTVDADSIDVILDLVAMAAAGDSVAAYHRLFGTRLAHVHVVDGTPAGHLVWGDGALPLGDYISDLGRIGYRGRLSFEPFGNGDYAMDPEKAWARNVAAIRPWLANE